MSARAFGGGADVPGEIRELHARQAQLLADLIRIPSTYEHEHAVLDFVEAQIDRLGLEWVSVPYDPDRLKTLPTALPPFSSVAGRRCVVARRRGTGNGPSLILNCHLDIVPSGPA
jgi:acetylornithine deacetylase